MNLKNIFKKVKEDVRIRKEVDFPSIGITIYMEPPTSMEEVKILSSCQDLEGAEYIGGVKIHSLAYAIKKINDTELSDDDDYDYVNKNGEKENLSKYLYMVRQLEEWPSAVRDILFEAFTDMQNEMEEKIKSMAKFKRFTTTTQSDAEESESKYRRVDEKEDENLDEVEKLNKKVKEEIDQANMELDRAAQKAEDEQG
jgi:hypothetical protein